MQKRIKYLLILVIALIILGIGATFAYFIAKISQEGKGSSTNVTTVKLEDTKIILEGNIEFNDLNIYPGHKNISSIKLSAIGDRNVIYNLIWTGENTLNTSLKYYVYKTTSKEPPKINCEKVSEGASRKIYYEKCTENDFQNLGEIISSGEITPTNEETKFKLIKNEEIQASKNKEEVYYYVVLEYPNLEESQNIDMNGSFNGKINIEILEEKDLPKAKDAILVGKDIQKRESFSTVLTDSENIIYEAEDNDGTTYYFAGNPSDNWVKFAGYYWRIIRINGDESIRLFYYGKDENATSIQKNVFNSFFSNNMYAGYMYENGVAHGLKVDSDIKIVLDNWYETNLMKYEDDISKEAGFCGDRTSTTTSGGAPDGTGGIGSAITYYGAYYRLSSNKIPTFKCEDKLDLYTVDNAAEKGNEALKYPIGLISADEIVYAGGRYGKNNTKYYLYTGEYHWTMTPYSFDGSSVRVFVINSKGSMIGQYVDSARSIYPVINLDSEVKFSGSGTYIDPFIVE